MKSYEGSTQQLVKLCVGYFVAYVLFGTATKWFIGPDGGMHEVAYLLYSSIGGSLICIAWVFYKGWWRVPAGVSTSALKYIIPSGICTAVVVPTTTMMYLLPISVMVAMVIMRAGVIVIGRVVDAIQIKQGILHRVVYWQENVGVVFALFATATILLAVDPAKDFNFVQNPAAMIILSCYLVAYAIRIYIMNYYKNTRPKGTGTNNEWFFAVEQIATSVALVLIALFVVSLPVIAGWDRPFYDMTAPAQIKAAAKDPIEALYVFRDSFAFKVAGWPGAIVAGATFGLGAFFSVFLFMFKGRTATFSNLVNRLTSLVAGTTSTLLFALLPFGGKFPKMSDWISLGFIFMAVAFLTMSERRRVAELKAANEIEAAAGEERGKQQ